VHTRGDRLNFGLERHPPWIAKGPGTYKSTFGRLLPHEHLQPSGRGMAHGDAIARAEGWDARFVVANVLSRDPVNNGQRRGLNNRRGTLCGSLSPSRPWAIR
jgi:hypothetical protein